MACVTETLDQGIDLQIAAAQSAQGQIEHLAPRASRKPGRAPGLRLDPRGERKLLALDLLALEGDAAGHGADLAASGAGLAQGVDDGHVRFLEDVHLLLNGERRPA